jgi:hypothetical protein
MRKQIFRITTASLILIAALGCARNADSVVPMKGLPDTPDGTVLAVAEALENYHAEILWEALPESYRKDLVEIIRAFAEKMDPAVYDQAFALVMRAVEVLDDRKDVILGSETFKSTGADADEIRNGLTNTQVFTDALKSSEISTLEGLGSMDPEEFLATTGSKMLEHAAAIEMEDEENPFHDIDSLKVEVVESADDQATLLVSSDNHDPEEVKMTRVEGRWIPADMAEEWPEFVEEARKGLDEMTPENMAAQKTQIMMVFGMADGLIEQIASLQTPEEFDAAIGPMLQGFMGMGAMGMDEEEAWEESEEEE